MCEHARRAAGRRRDVEAVRREPADHAVVDDEARPRRAGRHSGSARPRACRNVDVQAVRGIRPRPAPPPRSCRASSASNMPTDVRAVRHSRVDRRVHVLAGAREKTRALPLPDILEHRALRRAPRRASACVRTGSNSSPRVGPAMVPNVTGVYGWRNVVSPTAGIGLPSVSGDDRQRVDVRRLALVGRHAGRGVALDVLDGAKTFARRQLEILDRHVVLEIDESARLRRRCRTFAPTRPR